MANPNQEAMLRRSSDEWNRWRGENPEIRPDLKGLQWPGCRIVFANLSFADLRGAVLYGGSLRTSVLEHADLEGASINSVDCLRTDFQGANLARADLGATLFMLADLRGANLTGSKLTETVFGAADLTGAQGLAQCNFLGPSTLDLRTIIKSWPLPAVFLRGCGLAEGLIDYLPSLIQEAIQFYSCFISYSAKDQEFANRLHADLQDKGVRCWFAPHDIKAGRKIHDQIGDAVRLYDRLLLILSDDSMTSEWVRTEIAHARQKELNEKHQILFPISLVPFEKIRDWKCFDADTGKDSAREVREYFIPDFSNWKTHDTYRLAFQRLVRDLKASENMPTRADQE